MKYTISYKEAHKHFIDIELWVEAIESDKIYLQLPAWRPGRYELQNFARNIQKFEVRDEKGEKIPFRKISRERWELDTKQAKRVKVSYNCYCYQMDAGGCWLDNDQLYLNFIYCLMYPVGKENEPCSVKLEIPEDFEIACGLPKKEKTLFANDFFHLADSPMVASNALQHESYQSHGHTFHIWIQGNVNPDWKTILGDFKNFSDESIRLFGDFPEEDYHFIYEITHFRQYHGVEHRNSTIVTLGPAEIFNSGSMYENFLGISCHELFHAWNALKIRPKEMMPYDLTKENYFRTGFVIEGVTTYYGDQILARSGVITQQQYFAELDNVFKKHFENFGRFNLSLADSSFDLWIDGYVQGIPNRKVSIYGKGAIVSLILDLEIRIATENKKSLDDVMRHLWKEFGKKGRGYSEEDYQKIVDEVAGVSFKNYFDECIYGIVKIENRLNKALNSVGCELLISPNTSASERMFGFRTVQKDVKTMVDLLEPGSPSDKVLTKDDEILAIDNIEVENNINELIGEKESIEVTFGRSGKIHTKSISSDKKTYINQYKIIKRTDVGEKEKNNFKSWLNSDF